MIPRFTMRQALSAPDLLGNALVTPPCQHGVACSGSFEILCTAVKDAKCQ
jgi:hypothetical protein